MSYSLTSAVRRATEWAGWMGCGVVLVCLLGGTASAQWNAWDTVTADHTKVQGADQTNFPALVRIPPGSTLWAHTRADGYDVKFMDSTGVTDLKFERESWDTAAQVGIFWVKISTLSASVDTVIRMYYNNPGQSSDLQQPTQVWDSSYYAVYHMNDLSTTTVKDSTSNNRTASKRATGQPVETAGLFGRGQQYDGYDDYIQVGASSQSSYTYEAWYRPHVTNGFILCRGGTVFQFTNVLCYQPNQGIWEWVYDTTSGVGRSTEGTIVCATDTWHQVAGVAVNGSYTRLFSDGTQDGTDTILYTMEQLGTWYIGSHRPQYNPALNGIIDEVRISASARSANWIKSEYNNYSAPQSFWTFGNTSPTNTPTPTATPTATPTTPPGAFCSCSEQPNMSYDYNNVADPRNGAGCGVADVAGPLTPGAAINDQNNSGMVCCWAANPPGACVIDFNRTATVNRVRLWFQGNPGYCKDPKEYKIDLWDGSDWQEVVHVYSHGELNDEVEHSFEPQAAQKVRVTVLSSTVPDYWFSIAEMAVFAYNGDQPTYTPTDTPLYSPTWTPTSTPTWPPNTTPTPTWTLTSTPTWPPGSTPTPTFSPTFTLTSTSSPTATNTPTSTDTATSTPTPSDTPTWAPSTTPTPTFTPTATPDYFTELFSAADNDLDNLSLLFSPNGSSDFYSVCRSAATGFPVDPTGGTTLALGDDGSAQVTMSGGARVSLYGVDYAGFYVNANGNLTFTGGDYTYTGSLSAHFSRPRVAALFDDLYPGGGGLVSWKQLADRMVVTFEHVPQLGTSNSNNFQFELFFNGDLRITWLGIADTGGLAGLSRGSGLPAGFAESDLSGYSPCTTPTPSATPTASPTDTPTITPTDTPTNTPTAVPTDTPTDTPSVTPSATSSFTPSETPSSTPSVTPSETATLPLADTPTATRTFNALGVEAGWRQLP